MSDCFICAICEKEILDTFAMTKVEGFRKYFHVNCVSENKIQGTVEVFIGRHLDIICPNCDGSGEVAGDYFSEDGMAICRRCNGREII